MQTSLKNNSTFFDRILQLANNHGFKNINELAIKGLGYSSSQKLNRLKDPNTKPSLDIIEDISNKFENINLDWLLFGRGPMLTPVHADTGVAENVLAQMPAPTGAKEAHTATKAPKMGNYASDRLNDEKTRLYESLLAQYKAEISDANRHIGRLEERIEELQAKLDSSASHAVDAADVPARKAAGE